jgi:hypothetical protein
VELKQFSKQLGSAYGLPHFILQRRNIAVHRWRPHSYSSRATILCSALSIPTALSSPYHLAYLDFAFKLDVAGIRITYLNSKVKSFIFF